MNNQIKPEPNLGSEDLESQSFTKAEAELRKLGQTVQLSKAEKQAIKDRVLSTPLASAEGVKKIAWQSSFASAFWSRKALFMAACVVILLGSIPVTHAVQDSRPGDLLFNLELHLIEPIEEVFHFSEESKIEFAIERVEERLEELQDLPDGNLTAEQSNDTWENIDEHIDVILEAHDNLEQEEEIDNLIVVSGLLGAYDQESKFNRVEIDNLIIEVDTQLTEGVEDYVSGQSEAELTGEIEEYIEEAQLLIGEQSDSNALLIQETLADIEEELEDGDVDELFEEIVDVYIDALTYEYSLD